jgi:uncharacterized protein (TIGR02145 family)
MAKSAKHLLTIITVLPVYLIVLTCSDKVTLWPPEVITSEPTDVDQGGAVLRGEVLMDNHTKAGFEFGISTEYGQIIDQIEYVPNVNSHTDINFYLRTLLPNTTYHYRTKAESKQGIVYGDDVSFTTLDNQIVFNPKLNYGSLKDIDGNIYKTIQIGPQTWMAENLKATKYNDGSPITFVGPTDMWFVTGKAEYCWFANSDIRFRNTYGALYNWYAVNSLKLCPVGWHVPEDSEWQVLKDYLGGAAYIGNKIKETGGIHWFNPDINTTNESGFTALPGGYRNFEGTFKSQSANNIWKGTEAYWWTSTMAYSQGAFYMAIFAGSNSLLKSSWRFEMGHSVRCVKNNN